MNKKVFVVIDTYAGEWQGIIGVFTNEEYIKGKYIDKERYEIHTEYIDDSNTDSELIEYGRSDRVYDVHPYSEVGEKRMIMDACNITIGSYKKKNNKEIMSLMADLFIQFCNGEALESGQVFLTRFKDNDSAYMITYNKEIGDKYEEKFYNYVESKGIKISF